MHSLFLQHISHNDESDVQSILTFLINHEKKKEILDSLLDFHTNNNQVLWITVRQYSEKVKKVFLDINSENPIISKEHAILYALIEDPQTKYVLKKILHDLEIQERWENFSPSK